MWMKMHTAPHIFDPRGDLLLVLSKHSDPSDLPNDAEMPKDQNDVGNENKIPEGTQDGDGGKGRSTKPTHSEDLAPEAGFEESVRDETIKIPMLVSSRHMMLASPVFRAMLDGNFKEGCDLTSNGKVRVPLPDDNPAAFAIVLDIIHGHNRRVPREVDLELLTEISILVDKYQMVEAVEVFAESWIEGLKPGLPKHYRSEKQNVHRWIGISWVFDRSSEFKSMTKLTGRSTGAGLVNDVDDRLPIPTIILDNIMNQREQTLQAMYSFIDGKISAYQGTNLLCPNTAEFFKRYQMPSSSEKFVYPSHEASRFACDSMVLGSLLKSLVEWGLWPAPTSPYGPQTLDGLCIAIELLKLTSLCDQLQPPKWPYRLPLVGECHFLSSNLRTNVKAQRECISGLDLQNFKKAT